MPAPSLTCRKTLAGFLLACTLALGGWFSGARLAPAQVRAGGKAQPGKEQEKEKGKYLGALYCSACHKEPTRAFPTDHVLLNEYDTWSTEDRHSRAYEVLNGPRGKRMGEVLGKDVDKEVDCLSWHGGRCTEGCGGDR